MKRGNKTFRDAMARCGYRSVAELCRSCVPQQCHISVYRLIAGRVSPIGEDGRPCKVAAVIAETLGETVERLFDCPKLRAERRVVVMDFGGSHVRRLIASARLRMRERRVLMLSLDGFTYDEIAAVFGYSGSRIGQIYKKAARKIAGRHRLVAELGR